MTAEFAIRMVVAGRVRARGFDRLNPPLHMS
jgi:hypothetical protein